jgi:hypothetical protein
MSATPDPHVPEQPTRVPENAALEELESETEDELISPEEDVFQVFSDPHPTDGIGSEKWDRPADQETLEN